MGGEYYSPIKQNIISTAISYYFGMELFFLVLSVFF